MIVKLLTEHHFEFLSLIGGCRGSSEYTLVKMSNCWKSHAAAHYCNCLNVYSRFQVFAEISASKKIQSGWSPTVPGKVHDQYNTATRVVH